MSDPAVPARASVGYSTPQSRALQAPDQRDCLAPPLYQTNPPMKGEKPGHCADLTQALAILAKAPPAPGERRLRA